MIRSSVLASFCGAGELASVFASVNRTTMSFFDLFIGSAISGCFIPSLASRSRKRESFVSAFFITVVIASTTVALFGSVFSNQLAEIISPGLSSEMKTVTAELLRIFLPSVVAAGGAYVLTALCQTGKHRLLPAAISVMSNVFIIICLLVIGKIDSTEKLKLLSAVFVFSWIIQLFFCAIPFFPHLKISFKPDFKSIGAVLKKFPSSLAASWLLPFSISVTLLFSSASATNGSALFDYASVIFSAVIGILVSAIGGYAFPVLADSYHSKTDFIRKSKHCIKTAFAVSLPISILLSLLSKEIVSVLYLRGSFEASDATAVSEILSILSMSIPFCIINETLRRIFEAAGKNKYAALSAIVGIVSTLTAQILAYYSDAGLAGIASALTVGQLFASAFGLVTASVWLPETETLPHIENILLGSAVSAVASGLIYNLISPYLNKNIPETILCITAISLSAFASYLPFIKNKRKERIRE